jgi:hypothetical protein
MSHRGAVKKTNKQTKNKAEISSAMNFCDEKRSEYQTWPRHFRLGLYIQSVHKAARDREEGEHRAE